MLIPDCVRPVPAGGGGDPDPQYLVGNMLIPDYVRHVPAGGGGDRPHCHLLRRHQEAEAGTKVR